MYLYQRTQIAFILMWPPIDKDSCTSSEDEQEIVSITNGRYDDRKWTPRRKSGKTSSGDHAGRTRVLKPSPSRGSRMLSSARVSERMYEDMRMLSSPSRSTLPTLYKVRQVRENYKSEFFHIVKISLDTAGHKYNYKQSVRPVVACKNPVKLLQDQFNLTPRSMVKIGCDAGQGYLKFTAEVLDFSRKKVCSPPVILALTDAIETERNLRHVFCS